MNTYPFLRTQLIPNVYYRDCVSCDLKINALNRDSSRMSHVFVKIGLICSRSNLLLAFFLSLLSFSLFFSPPSLLSLFSLSFSLFFSHSLSLFSFSLYLSRFRDIPSMDGGESSQHRHRARCNFRVTYHNAFFIARTFLYSPVVREFFSSGRTRSRNRTCPEKKKKTRRERERERKRETLFERFTAKDTSIRSLSPHFYGLPMDRDLRHFCVIPMADIELLPARTHQRSNVRWSQLIWWSPKRRTTLNRHESHAYAHTITHVHIRVQRHAHTYSR